VKCLHWIIVILGIGLVSLAPITHRPDAPETAYDETDTPVSLTRPDVVGLNLTMPSEKLGATPTEQWGSWEPDITTHEVALKPGVRDSQSRLSLLCKFLC
jgi:hypothetical protein